MFSDNIKKDIKKIKKELISKNNLEEMLLYDIENAHLILHLDHAEVDKALDVWNLAKKNGVEVRILEV